MYNYTRDGGGPSEAALQEEASNHSKLRWLRARVVSVREKVSCKISGKGQGDKEIEPLLKCRKHIGVQCIDRQNGSRPRI